MAAEGPRRPLILIRVAAAAAVLLGLSALNARDTSASRPPEPVAVHGDRVPVSSAQLAGLQVPLPKAVERGSILNIRETMHYGQFVWNDEGVPQGPVSVRVDLARQTISVFRAGHEIGTAVILYGTDGKPTPTGTFPILARLKDHRSSIYDAAMPYTLRLTGDGIAIHGSNVTKGLATHGCVGIPRDFAALLFDQVERGDPVIIV
jgi:hypothetical protein